MAKKTFEERMARGRAALETVPASMMLWRQVVAEAVVRLLARGETLSGDAIIDEIAKVGRGPITMDFGEGFVDEVTSAKAIESLREAMALHRQKEV